MVREAFSFSHAATNTNVYSSFIKRCCRAWHISLVILFSFILAYGVKQYFESFIRMPWASLLMGANVSLRQQGLREVTIVFPRVALLLGGAGRSQRNSSLSNIRFLI